LKSLLGLVGIGRDPSTLSPEERTLESYYNRLNVYAVEKSRVIAIDFDSANPDLAASVANTVAETYLKMQQSSKQDQTRAAGDWLAGEIANLRTKVADAEAKVEQYRARSNLFVGTNNTSLPTSSLPRSTRRFRRRAARKLIWRRGHGNYARSSARVSQSNPPTSPIRIQCAG